MGQVRRWIDWIYVFITGNAVIFWACMVINMIGVVWGGIVWYGPMLVSSPAWAWIFIPDCPAAALYATVAFVLLRYQRPVPWFTAFAAFACVASCLVAARCHRHFSNNAPKGGFQSHRPTG